MIIRQFARFIIVLAIFSKASAQSTGGDSYEVLSDARSVSSGESFTGVPANAAAFETNPAGIVGTNPLEASFNRREENVFNPEGSHRYWSANVNLGWPAISVSIFTAWESIFNGEVIYSDPGFIPDTALGRVRDYDFTIGLVLTRKINTHFAVGITLKRFANVQETSPAGSLSYYTHGGAYGMYVPSLNAVAYACDFGVLYTFSGILQSNQSPDHFSIGGAIQNLGSDLVTEFSGARFVTRLHRYARIGVSYSVDVFTKGNANSVPARCLFTAEYGGILNHYSDFGGFGGEITAYGIFSARVGGYIPKWNSDLGPWGKVGWRFGGGVCLPVYRIAEGVPLEVIFDYAYLPVHWPYSRIFGAISDGLSILSIGCHYVNPIL